MESETISDTQLSASSQMDGNHSAAQARLHFKADGSIAGGWSALKNDGNQWFQIDLGSYTRVSGVATQGRDAYKEWVTKFKLQYSDDSLTFKFNKEPGEHLAKVGFIQSPRASRRIRPKKVRLHGQKKFLSETRFGKMAKFWYKGEFLRCMDND